MSTSSGGEDDIRQKIVENDLVDCMVALPGQLFYTTPIPVCLWFLTKSKKARKVKGRSESNQRERTGETLFIDARNHGSMLDRTHKEFTEADIAEITDTYHAWRGEAKSGEYEDKPGFCKSSSIEDIKANDYSLTPSRYVGTAPLEDDGIPFETKMTDLTATLYQQMADAKKLDKSIQKNLEALGYGS